MSDNIQHECGLAMIRLRKPLRYYYEKYGTALYGLNKLFLLMQKQYNRGQDGVGIATVKLDMPAGYRYISRKRNNQSEPVKSLFSEVQTRLAGFPQEKLNDPEWCKMNMPYTGEVLLGHLRYGTHGGNSIENCHPFHRQNNWMTRNLIMAGNFNLTNVDFLFNQLVELGQHPKDRMDTVLVMEKIGHFLDGEVERLFKFFKAEGYDNATISRLIADNIEIKKVLERASRKFDGGYVMGGVLGHGDAFIMRDPHGIRPAFWYEDEEIVVAASERPAIMTCFDINYRLVKEVQPGHALIIRKNGEVSEEQISNPVEKKACSFERIYFSRGNDRDIYSERKKLGEQLAETILERVNYDFENTVFTYIPNTAESSYYGLMEGVNVIHRRIQAKTITDYLADNGRTPETMAHINDIISAKPRFEKLVHKDIKLRTFITEDSSRNELVSYIYDVTYGLVQDYTDTLVLLDDSIVRGTTLEQSILRIVSRLKPKKIIIVSSAPQIRYPDCYGIDMSKLREFVAFQAMIRILKESDRGHLIDEVYQRCKAQQFKPDEEITNEVQFLYDQCGYEEISNMIAQIVRPDDMIPELEVIYQTLDGLHSACPNHTGDWYFSGKFPTPGGNRVTNTAFIYYYEGIDKRGY